MPIPQQIYEKIIQLLNDNQVEYKLFEHRVALTWEELEQVQKETGFFGSELKCMVMKAADKFFVYVTMQGNKVDMKAVKIELGVSKVSLVSVEELKENFAAEPGCAYPFGFNEKFDIYVDPEIYKQDWVLFSPVFPSCTIQAWGEDLRKVMEKLSNKVREIENFNQ